MSASALESARGVVSCLWIDASFTTALDDDIDVRLREKAPPRPRPCSLWFVASPLVADEASDRAQMLSGKLARHVPGSPCVGNCGSFTAGLAVCSCPVSAATAGASPSLMCLGAWLNFRPSCVSREGGHACVCVLGVCPSVCQGCLPARLCYRVFR